MLVTELTRRLGLAHPIIQAGMGGGAGWELAAAVSNAGGLGTIGTITRSPEETVAEIEALDHATDGAFAVNVVCFDWASFPPAHLDAVLGAGPPVVTLSFGDPGPPLAQCREAGVTTLVQVQDLNGLTSAIEGGADAIIVQGNEAGGHTGRRGTLNFVAQALELAGEVPIVAAGGIGNGRGLAAALAMGCAGALMGTRFKATHEFVADDLDKKELVASDGSDTVYDEIHDLVFGDPWPNGVAGRTLRNDFTDEWLGRQEELRARVSGYPPLGFALELAERGTVINWAGEGVGLIEEVLPAAEVVAQTVAEAEECLRRASRLVSEPPAA